MNFLKPALIALTVTSGSLAWANEDPNADSVEIRHGVMLLMANQLEVLGNMAKEVTAYDQATAAKAATNLVALASVVSPDMFPAGSEYGASEDSFALPAIWSNPDDFVSDINDLNAAAATMQGAASTDLASLKSAMGVVGGACSACHKVYRQPEE
jgi:cytochrome c556